VPQTHSVNPRFLIVRHPRFRRFFFDVFVHWAEANFPDLAPRFDVRDLPVRVRNWSDYALHAAWLQDPVQRWSMTTYDRALKLAHDCEEHGIPVINRVDRLINATKSRGAKLMNAAGIQTARMAVIDNRREFESTLLGLRLPLFIREDWGHSRRMTRVDTPAGLQNIRWRRFKRPLAVEIVDVRDPHDGVYRKYRYFALGELGICHHLQISREWITRGDNRTFTPQAQREELDYISRPDPNHEALQTARKALGLDMAAFDYGYTADGRMIVWEANPFPHLEFSTRALTYRNAAIHRTMMGILHLYLTAARMPVPPELLNALALDLPSVQQQFKIGRQTNFADRLQALRSYLPRRAA